MRRSPAYILSRSMLVDRPLCDQNCFYILSSMEAVRVQYSRSFGGYLLQTSGLLRASRLKRTRQGEKTVWQGRKKAFQGWKKDRQGWKKDFQGWKKALRLKKSFPGLKKSFSPSRYSGVQFFMSSLNSHLRTRRFSEVTFRPSRHTNHWKTQHFATSLTFRACWSSFFPHLLIFFLAALLFQLSILSEVRLLNFLRQYDDTIWKKNNITHLWKSSKNIEDLRM